MFRFFIIFFFTIIFFKASAYNYNKEKIIENLKSTSNFSFQFEQNINGKVESGNCTIKYPKKIYCIYEKNNKLLVSNGKSLVIKTTSSFYRYSLKKTPLNLILDKKFLIERIYNFNEKIVDQSYIIYSIIENENEIEIFFDINSYNLIGWKTTDIYQNTSLTLLYSIVINQKIKKNLFELPQQN